jgi:flagellar protein FlaG
MEIRSINYPAKPVTVVTDKPEPNANLPGSASKPATVPVTESAVQQPSRSAGVEQTKQAVQDIERMMKLFSKNLEFSYDASENRAIMRVVDQQTKEVIRQVPTEEALEIARALEKIQDTLLLQGSKNFLSK